MLEKNFQKGTIDISLKYDKRIIIVTFRPSLKGLECLKVTEGKKEIRGDERYQLIAVAEREFWARVEKGLEPRPSHVRVSSLVERVEISFAYTLFKYDPADKVKFMPLGYEDLRVLQMLAQRISERVGKRHEEARAQVRKLHSGYLDDIKSGVLMEWRDETPCNQELRDFYSSVLGRAFSWKQGRVPYETHTEAMKYLPGIKLAFG